MRVRDPQGRTWRVTRRWTPWRPRRRGLGPDVLIDGADPIGFVFFLAVGLILLPLLSIAVFFVIELVLLLLALPVAVLLRLAFGKKWWIEARLGLRPFWEEEAGDWRASGLRIHEVASAIERGDPPAPTLGDDRPASDDSERSSGRNPG